VAISGIGGRSSSSGMACVLSCRSVAMSPGVCAHECVATTAASSPSSPPRPTCCTAATCSSTASSSASTSTAGPASSACGSACRPPTSVPRQLAAAHPVTLVVFDVLHLDGRAVRALPYAARRKLLTPRTARRRRQLEDPHAARRRTRGRPGRHPCSPARGHRRQTPRLPLRTRTPQRRLAQAQAPPTRRSPSSAGGRHHPTSVAVTRSSSRARHQMAASSQPERSSSVSRETSAVNYALRSSSAERARAVARIASSPASGGPGLPRARHRPAARRGHAQTHTGRAGRVANATDHARRRCAPLTLRPRESSQSGARADTRRTPFR
jgi:hypothetical protein